MKYNIIFITLLFLLTLGFANANELATLGENFIVWADIIASNEFYPISYVELSIYDPYENLSIFINMTEFSPGIYNYNFTPNISGEWYVVAAYHNTTNKVALTTSTISVTSGVENMTKDLTIIISLIGFIIYLFYLADNFFERAKGNVNRQIKKYIGLKALGAFLHLLVSWLILVVFAFITYIATGQAYAYLMDMLFYIIVLLVMAFNVLYLWFFIIFTIQDVLTWKKTINMK